MTDTKFEEDKKIQVRKWADDNVWWIVAMIALTVLSIMLCIAGSVLYDIQPAIMGVVATLAIFIALVMLMVIRRCALQGESSGRQTTSAYAFVDSACGSWCCDSWYVIPQVFGNPFLFVPCASEYFDIEMDIQMKTLLRSDPYNFAVLTKILPFLDANEDKGSFS